MASDAACDGESREEADEETVVYVALSRRAFELACPGVRPLYLMKSPYNWMVASKHGGMDAQWPAVGTLQTP